jgi:hypothetical protein
MWYARYVISGAVAFSWSRLVPPKFTSKSVILKGLHVGSWLFRVYVVVYPFYAVTGPAKGFGSIRGRWLKGRQTIQS